MSFQITFRFKIVLLDSDNVHEFLYECLNVLATLYRVFNKVQCVVNTQGVTRIYLLAILSCELPILL